MQLFILQIHHHPWLPCSASTRECIKMQRKATAVSGKVERGWGKVLETGNHCLIHHFMFSGLHAARDTGGKYVSWIKQDYLLKKIKQALRFNPLVGWQINYLKLSNGSYKTGTTMKGLDFIKMQPITIWEPCYLYGCGFMCLVLVLARAVPL